MSEVMLNRVRVIKRRDCVIPHSSHRMIDSLKRLFG